MMATVKYCIKEINLRFYMGRKSYTFENAQFTRTPLHVVVAVVAVAVAFIIAPA